MIGQEIAEVVKHPEVIKNFQTAVIDPVERSSLATRRKTMALFEAALIRFRDTPDLKVMLVRSTGRYFCSGADMKSGGSPRDYPRTPSGIPEAMPFAMATINEWKSPDFQYPQPLEMWLLLAIIGALIITSLLPMPARHAVTATANHRLRRAGSGVSHARIAP